MGSFYVGGEGFRTPSRPTERIRYCQTCGPVSTADWLPGEGHRMEEVRDDGMTVRVLCSVCLDFIAGRRPVRVGFRQRYLDTAERYGITPQ